MKHKNLSFQTLRNISTSAICVAFCVILPLIMHSIPKAGLIYSPIHIPVLLCALICPWQYAAVCGLLGPLVSSAITGMPAAALLPSMMIECATYGLIGAIVMKLVHTKNSYLDVYISLITSMLVGRVVAGITKALLFTDGYSLKAWISTYFVTALPGIIIHLLLIPIIYKALSKSKLILPR